MRMKIPLIDQTINPWLALSLSVSGAARQGATLPWPRTRRPQITLSSHPPSFSSTRRLSFWSTRWTLDCSAHIVLNPLGRWFPLTPKRSHFEEAADFRSTRFLDLPSTTIYAPCDRHADRLPVKGDIPRRLALPTSLSLLPPPRPLPSYPDGLSRGLDSPTWRRSSCWRR